MRGVHRGDVVALVLEELLEHSGRGVAEVEIAVAVLIEELQSCAGVSVV